MKPILFSTSMVQAILDGRKTQTRRIVKEDKRGQWVAVNNARNLEFGASVPCYLHREVSVDDKSRNIMYPKYDVGDILWVRETWATVSSGIIEYKATYIEPYTGSTEIDHIGKKITWRPSIHMPREAARIFLRVKNVRVERLRDITEEDAIAEGIRIGIGGEPYFSCRDAFVALWDSINTKRGYGWDTNPWVWVVEFERMSKEEAYKKEGLKC